MNSDNNQSEIITDCNYTLEEALSGKDIPEEIKADQRIVEVYYFSFDNKLHKGQVVIQKDLVEDIKWIFEKIKGNEFPVDKVIPVVKFNWSDEKSMKANNSSAFNYRFIANTTKLSNHSTGRAIDINPWQNPQIINGTTFPSGAKYQPDKKGTITKNSIIVKLFKEKGWNWGGDWKTRVDYQHFEKLK
ncbi:MAG TPA: M15 family metallopeptidase [Ignavibacteriaceae bacterium]|nr:M15 family metallopeptidase [Ignavibacteriaceae bacterium]